MSDIGGKSGRAGDKGDERVDSQSPDYLVAWPCDQCSLSGGVSAAESFFCVDGIKRRNAGLVRQMARHLNVLCRAEIWSLENHYGFATESGACFRD
jgi:hypothetical protein